MVQGARIWKECGVKSVEFHPSYDCHCDTNYHLSLVHRGDLTQSGGVVVFGWFVTARLGWTYDSCG